MHTTGRRQTGGRGGQKLGRLELLFDVAHGVSDVEGLTGSDSLMRFAIAPGKAQGVDPCSLYGNSSLGEMPP